jgi:hypothetical protein
MSTAANLLVLNKRCEFWFNGQNVAAPLAACSVRDLPAVLDQVGAAELSVEFHTTSNPDDVAADRKKYGKRLAGIGPNWTRGEWSPKVVRGHTLDHVYACTLIRREA